MWKNDCPIWTLSRGLDQTMVSVPLYSRFISSMWNDSSTLSSMKIVPTDRFVAAKPTSYSYRGGVAHLFGSPTTFGELYSLVSKLEPSRLNWALIMWNCLSDEDRVRVTTYAQERRALLTLLTGHRRQGQFSLPAELWEQVVEPMI